MAITGVKVHPAIGIARVGNSPEEFFVGPERLWDPPDPDGGFKDSQCRVKRQAARFRLYAYHDDGTATELTSADADFVWTVHVANRKAIARNPAADATDMTIDPGSRTLTGPGQREPFDTGRIRFPGQAEATVPLGEARTDDEGRLLVLGGLGKSASPGNVAITNYLDNEGWFDDVSDGPVTARVTVKATGEVFDAAGAWVIVGPPKFAPQIDNVVTLYDYLFQMGVARGWLTAPATPSYTADIHPMIERARTTGAVADTGYVHAWPEPVYAPLDRQKIFNRLKIPGGGGGNMPQLDYGELTATQYAVMKAWREDNFTRDWTGPPTPSTHLTPAELDRAALTACVGDTLSPGIEAGGIGAGIVISPIADPANYVGAADPMRLDHTRLVPGAISEFMAVPWQADFKNCGRQWWPVPRPNDVIPQGANTRLAWDRDVSDFLEMTTEWHTLGFVVRQGGSYVEVDRCEGTFVTLLTPHLNFRDVPQGPMGMFRTTALVVSFDVRSNGGPVTLEVPPADRPTNSRLTLITTSATVGPTAGNEIATVRLWLVYRIGPVDELVTDRLTVRNVAGGQSWTVTVTANTVAREAAAIVLVLDRSGSMNEDRGDGRSKHRTLTDAAATLVDVMVEGDGVGVVGYNEEAKPLQNITALGPLGDPVRQSTKDVLGGPGLAPSGETSIGEGIREGRALLAAAGTGFGRKALVVLTDGNENQLRRLADVAAEVNEHTYAVGLGSPQNTTTAALQALSGNNGGHLLVTGAITGDNRLVLQKYFLQILAGIGGMDTALASDGVVLAGQQQRIPFQLTEADAGIEVIVLAELPESVDFRVQTPNGFVIEPSRARVDPTMTWMPADGVQYYRLLLPTELHPARYDQPGTWHALLTAGQQDMVPYSLVVHSWSSLSLRAALRQSGFEPGAIVTLTATVTEAGALAVAGVAVWAEVSHPDGSTSTVTLSERQPGAFEGDFAATVVGLYRCRVRAAGRSRKGHAFQREQTVTAGVWLGGGAG